MSTLHWPLLCGTIFVLLLVIAEVRNLRPGIWIFKPLASCCFIWLAWISGAWESDYGRWLLAGLIACWFGDVLLIPQRSIAFLGGLSSFLLGHLLFAIAFAQPGWNTLAVLSFGVPAVALGTFALRWLNPHLTEDMRIPVYSYILVICCMLASAGNGFGGNAGTWILAGAWGFALSDLAVARDRFIKPGPLNRVWGLPLYFASQFVLAWTPGFFA